MGRKGKDKMGYEFIKKECPACHRMIAVNHYELSHGRLLFRKHKGTDGKQCRGW